jgi:PPK2 family polyphosphate:nucleotide phosphotransferase
MMHLKPITPRTNIQLGDRAAHRPKGAPSGKALEARMAHEAERIGKLQHVFYADARRSLLIVLQGRDASGKDGTVRHVFRAVNPQGCNVTSFKAPTHLELSHDYLWRIHTHVPARGMIGIFNRSHYEDVLVPRVHKAMPRHAVMARYRQINDFERMLTENDVIILKFFLHVSRDEQRRRLQDRLTDEHKNWKFREGDLADRLLWPQYTKAYKGLLAHCSTPYAPWYLVPADDKPVRDWLIARTIADTLDGLDLRFPPADPAVRSLTVE